MSPTAEFKEAREALRDVEDLDAAERKVGPRTKAARGLRRVRERIAGTSVRMSTAAKLLELSVPTVNQWADEAILEDVGGSPRGVTLRSVARIAPIVGELRDLGQHQNLRDAVLARLEDRGTIEDKRFLRSLEEMRRGELVDLTPPA